MKIVSFTICPFVQRVTALLEAKNINYDIEYINLNDKPQWFLDISPNGQVPLLITDGGAALFESDAIVEYIEEITKPLETEVTPEQRALDRAWSYMATKHYLVQCSTMRSADKATYGERSDKLNKAFAKVESALSDGPFFKGTMLSNVDIAWLPLLHRAKIVAQHSHIDPLEAFPKVKAWQQALAQTPLFEKSVADSFEEKLIDFYLSEKTYLGQGNNALGKCMTTNQQAVNASCC